MSFVLSPPCGGKTTQGRLLSESGVSYVDTSHLITVWIKKREGARASRCAQSVMEQGKPVDDIIVNELVGSWLETVLDAEVFLGGFPRTLRQVEYLGAGLPDRMREAWRILNPTFFVLEVPMSECRRRRGVSSDREGRLDGDKEKVFTDRLDDHFKTIDPIVKRLNALYPNSVVHIDGSLPAEEIYSSLRSSPAFA